jgi:flagellar biosynthesis GTPase FlhF
LEILGEEVIVGSIVGLYECELIDVNKIQTQIQKLKEEKEKEIKKIKVEKEEEIQKLKEEKEGERKEKEKVIENKEEEIKKRDDENKKLKEEKEKERKEKEEAIKEKEKKVSEVNNLKKQLEESKKTISSSSSSSSSSSFSSSLSSSPFLNSSVVDENITFVPNEEAEQGGKVIMEGRKITFTEKCDQFYTMFIDKMIKERIVKMFIYFILFYFYLK